MSDNPFSRYNRQENIQSLYHYQDTEVYINKLGIKDPDILSSIENDLTHQRLSELYLNPIPGRFGKTHLLKVHKYIFQDLYPFQERLEKRRYGKGIHSFVIAGLFLII